MSDKSDMVPGSASSRRAGGDHVSGAPSGPCSAESSEGQQLSILLPHLGTTSSLTSVIRERTTARAFTLEKGRYGLNVCVL